jgi:hypothetical protein
LSALSACTWSWCCYRYCGIILDTFLLISNHKHFFDSRCVGRTRSYSLVDVKQATSNMPCARGNTNPAVMLVSFHLTYSRRLQRVAAKAALPPSPRLPHLRRPIDQRDGVVEVGVGHALRPHALQWNLAPSQSTLQAKWGEAECSPYRSTDARRWAQAPPRRAIQCQPAA